MKPRILAALLAVAVVAIGSLQLTRPGYSVDEEFTVFAVRGIAQHGLPILPSGLLYDRGIGYSYAAWAAGAITGSELPAFRAVSLFSAALSVLLTFFLVRRVAGDIAAVTASAMLVLSVPFWATATSARFYAPFLGAYLLTLYFLTHRHWWIGLIAAAAIARLTHELAFTLAAIPAVCWLVARGDRRFWFLMTLSVIAGLVIGQAVLFGFHYAAPASGETMVRRFFLWQVINLFERPGDRQFAIPFVVLLVGLVLAPKRAWLLSVIALSIATMILAFAIAQASNSAPLSLALVRGVLEDGSRYPLDMFWHVLRLTPLTVIAALLFIAYRARREWPPKQRAAHAVWIGWVLWFGVIESGITTNYLLLPLSFLLIAIAIDASSTAVPRLAVAALALIIGIDQWRGNTLEAARPTIRVEGIDDIRSGLQANDRVACTDELGCMMLVGRVDRWLALDDYVRERFVVQKPDGTATGVYTGVPAAFRPGDLFNPDPDGSLPDRVVIVDIFKDYPIGSSRSWVPRAIEQDGLQVTPLLETPQMRVLQVSPREQVASLRLGALTGRRQP
ncbi:MAG TPA: glycosyltransferase family 39 protein [Vicinamibacterales bacterium]